MNRTLLDLREHLGAPVRFHIDAEPARRKRPVITAVLWPCGCRAEGVALTALTLAPCAAHAPERSGLRGVPMLGGLLTRP